MPKSGDILTVNMGSSSLKLSIWDAELTRSVRGEIERIGEAPRLTLSTGGSREWGEAGAKLSPQDLIGDALAEFGRGQADRIGAIGHRIVHGGRDFDRPVLVDPGIMDALAALEPLAPLHQPHGLAGIRACQALFPDRPQVAAFDTAFHRTLLSEAARYAVPREIEEAGIRRYGFHGLSFAYVARELARTEPELRRVVIAHLGNGASLCALAGGRSLDTTMGFTPLDGLVMGTRPGLLDPGIVTWLMREKGMDAAAIEDLLYRRSGLLGVSGGLARDMRALEASDDPRAAEAISLFVFRAAREIGALAATLGGLDGLVFTAGIGQNSPTIRTRIVERCAWLGAGLDEAANASGRPGRISPPMTACAVLIVPTDEEREIAGAVRSVVAVQPPSGDARHPA